MSTYVYLISDGTFIKIGRSATPERRLRALQSANARKLTLIASHRAPRHVEGLLHDLFKGANVRGEWFELTEEDLTRIESIVSVEADLWDKRFNRYVEPVSIEPIYDVEFEFEI